MQKQNYICSYIATAEPMTRETFNNFTKGSAVKLPWPPYMPENTNATTEGYLVHTPYYGQWLSKAEFEAISRPVDGMTFGQAIEAMKQGKKVARRGWNGKGMWICIPLCNGPKEIPATGIWGKPNAEYAQQNGGTVKVMPYITMKAADGSIVMGWLASQTDMLSEDWCIVE